MQVKIYFNKHPLYGEKQETLKNITEIHYNYPSVFKDDMIAFESNIDKTGYTYKISDIKEFEAK